MQTALPSDSRRGSVKESVHSCLSADRTPYRILSSPVFGSLLRLFFQMPVSSGRLCLFRQTDRQDAPGRNQKRHEVIEANLAPGERLVRQKMGKLVDPVQERTDHQRSRDALAKRVRGEDDSRRKRHETFSRGSAAWFAFGQCAPFLGPVFFWPSVLIPNAFIRRSGPEVRQGRAGQMFCRIRDSGTIRPFRTPIVSSTISFIPHR